MIRWYWFCKNLMHEQMLAIVQLVCGGLLTVFAGNVGGEDGYPTRPVQVIVPYSAGGISDVMSRSLAAGLSTLLGQQFVVVNRDGASGTIGFGRLAVASPDGYTLGAGPTTPISVGPHIMPSVKYGVDSFEYVCQTFENIFTITVPAQSPYRSIDELIAEIRARPHTLTYGHSGVGSVPHLSVANFARHTGLDVIATAYRGDAALLPDLLSGRLQFGAPSVGGVVGRNVRVLAVFAERRHPAFPDAPTFAELRMPSMPAGLNGLYAPKRTSPNILQKLERACEQVAQSESFRTTAAQLFQPVVFLKSSAFAEVARNDFRYKGELIRALNISAE